MAGMIKGLDTDGDGKVTIKEWLLFFVKQATVGADVEELIDNITARLDSDAAAAEGAPALTRRLSRETSEAIQATADFASLMEQLTSLFARIDKDQSGAIEAEECIRMCGGNETMARAMLKSLDTNEDGLVSVDEWYSFFLKMHSVGGAAKVNALCGNIDARLSGAEAKELAEDDVQAAENLAGCDDAALAARIARAFARIDASGNGTIEREECVKFCGGEEAADGMMKGLDANADGMVTSTEFFQFFLADKDRAWDRLKVVESKLP